MKGKGMNLPMNSEELNKKKKDFEKGIISFKDLTEEEMEKMIKSYDEEIKRNKADIKETKEKIKQLKKKIDDMV